MGILMDTLSFHHPAVWWISRQVRPGSEGGAEDLAVQVLENRIAGWQSQIPHNRPSRIRTYDLRIRNPLLYPTEL